ncbi:unnamed protein product, partial [Iphiclides podalirius]
MARGTAEAKFRVPGILITGVGSTGLPITTGTSSGSAASSTTDTGSGAISYSTGDGETTGARDDLTLLINVDDDLDYGLFGSFGDSRLVDKSGSDGDRFGLDYGGADGNGFRVDYGRPNCNGFWVDESGSDRDGLFINYNGGGSTWTGLHKAVCRAGNSRGNED